MFKWYPKVFKAEDSVQLVYIDDCIDGMVANLPDGTIDLIVTSPPYWNIKSYDFDGQIGYGQSLNQYRKSMRKTFVQCFRVLKEARRMSVNIGDVAISSGANGDEKDRGNFEMVPLHAYLIIEAERAGFTYLGTIHWEKTTKCKSQNSAPMNFMGSVYYPPNAHIATRKESILIFRKKESTASKPEWKPPKIRAISKLTKEQWIEYTSDTWRFEGEHVEGHPAAFPVELPYRCIAMWSFVGETVLDPFLGSGTSLLACQKLKRNGIGFEANTEYEDLISERLSKATRIRAY